MAKPKPADIGLLVLRLSGLMFAWHGWGKITASPEGLQKFVDGVGYLGFPQPEIFAWAAILTELVGGIAIALGLYTRVFAVLAAFTMVVAAFVRHADDPFSVKEKALLYLVICLGLALTGGGSLTLDSIWRTKRKKGH